MRRRCRSFVQSFIDCSLLVFGDRDDRATAVGGSSRRSIRPACSNSTAIRLAVFRDTSWLGELGDGHRPVESDRKQRAGVPCSQAEILLDSDRGTTHLD